MTSLHLQDRGVDLRIPGILRRRNIEYGLTQNDQDVGAVERKGIPELNVKSLFASKLQMEVKSQKTTKELMKST